MGQHLLWKKSRLVSLMTLAVKKHFQFVDERYCVLFATDLLHKQVTYKMNVFGRCVATAVTKMVDSDASLPVLATYAAVLTDEHKGLLPTCGPAFFTPWLLAYGATSGEALFFDVNFHWFYCSMLTSSRKVKGEKDQVEAVILAKRGFVRYVKRNKDIEGNEIAHSFIKSIPRFSGIKVSSTDLLSVTCSADPLIKMSIEADLASMMSSLQSESQFIMQQLTGLAEKTVQDDPEPKRGFWGIFGRSQKKQPASLSSKGLVQREIYVCWFIIHKFLELRTGSAFPILLPPTQALADNCVKAIFDVIEMASIIPYFKRHNSDSKTVSKKNKLLCSLMAMPIIHYLMRLNVELPSEIDQGDLSIKMDNVYRWSVLIKKGWERLLPMVSEDKARKAVSQLMYVDSSHVLRSSGDAFSVEEISRPGNLFYAALEEKVSSMQDQTVELETMWYWHPNVRVVVDDWCRRLDAMPIVVNFCEDDEYVIATSEGEINAGPLEAAFYHLSGLSFQAPEKETAPQKVSSAIVSEHVVQALRKDIQSLHHEMMHLKKKLTTQSESSTASDSLTDALQENIQRLQTEIADLKERLATFFESEKSPESPAADESMINTVKESIQLLQAEITALKEGATMLSKSVKELESSPSVESLSDPLNKAIQLLQAEITDLKEGAKMLSNSVKELESSLSVESLSDPLNKAIQLLQTEITDLKDGATALFQSVKELESSPSTESFIDPLSKAIQLLQADIGNLKDELNKSAAGLYARLEEFAVSTEVESKLVEYVRSDDVEKSFEKISKQIKGLIELSTWSREWIVTSDKSTQQEKQEQKKLLERVDNQAKALKHLVERAAKEDEKLKEQERAAHMQSVQQSVPSVKKGEGSAFKKPTGYR